MLRICAVPIAAWLIVAPLWTAQAQVPDQGVIDQRLGAQWTKAQRDRWFNDQLRGRSVTWTGQVMSVQKQTFGGVIVEMLRQTPRASFDCVVPAERSYFEKFALSLTVGQQAVCAGAINSYQRVYGEVRLRIDAATVNVVVP